MTFGQFFQVCVALAFVAFMLGTDDTDAAVRYGIAAIVFAIVANTKRRGSA